MRVKRGARADRRDLYKVAVSWSTLAPRPTAAARAVAVRGRHRLDRGARSAQDLPNVEPVPIVFDRVRFAGILLALLPELPSGAPKDARVQPICGNKLQAPARKIGGNVQHGLAPAPAAHQLKLVPDARKRKAPADLRRGMPERRSAHLPQIASS